MNYIKLKEWSNIINRIDVNTDTKTIIQSKIDIMKFEISLGNMTEIVILIGKEYVLWLSKIWLHGKLFL